MSVEVPPIELAGEQEHEIVELTPEDSRLYFDCLKTLKLQDTENGTRCKVLKDIMPRLVDTLAASMLNHREEFIKHDRYNRAPETVYADGEAREKFYKDAVKGTLFEMLVQHEFKQGTSEIGEYLLAFGQNPERFNAHLGTHRNPDLAFYDIDEQGNITIRAFAEATTGYLTKTKLEQLSDTGHVVGLGKIAGKINEYLADSDRSEVLGEHGLLGVFGDSAESAPYISHIAVAPSIKRLLVLPEGRKLPDLNLVKQFYQLSADHKQDQQTEEMRMAALDFNKIVPGSMPGFDALKAVETLEKVTVLNSVFNPREIATLADMLYKKVNEKLQADVNLYGEQERAARHTHDLEVLHTRIAKISESSSDPKEKSRAIGSYLRGIHDQIAQPARSAPPDLKAWISALEHTFPGQDIREIPVTQYPEVFDQQPKKK